MTIAPATWAAEAGESLESGRRGEGCNELRSRHCTPAWATRVKLYLKKKKRKRNNIMSFMKEDPTDVANFTVVLF